MAAEVAPPSTHTTDATATTPEQKETVPNRKHSDNNVVKFHTTAQIVYIGNVQMTQQTFEARVEVVTHRELTETEVVTYTKTPFKFKPQLMLQCYPIGAANVIQRELMCFNTSNTFNISKDDPKECKYRAGLTLWRVWIIHCVFMEDLTLQAFPFDVQHFEMVMQFRPEPDDIAQTVLDETATEFSMQSVRSNIAGWDFVGLELPLGRTQYWDRERSFVIILKRQWKFYMYRVVLVLCIIGLITLSVFAFGEESTADRFGFISTTLLTVVAYMFIIKEYLPQLNYLTLLDKYIYFILLFIGMIAIQSVFENFDIIQIDNDIDLVFFIADLILYVVVHLIFVTVAYTMNRTENEKSRKPKFSIDELQGLYLVDAEHYDHMVNYTKPATGTALYKQEPSTSYFKYTIKRGQVYGTSD